MIDQATIKAAGERLKAEIRGKGNLAEVLKSLEIDVEDFSKQVDAHQAAIAMTGELALPVAMIWLEGYLVGKAEADGS